MQGHDTFKAAVHAHVRGHARGRRRAGLDARRHRPVRLPPGQRPHPRARSASGSASTRERVVDCIDRYGNTSAATLPIALARRARARHARAGRHVLLAAFGAGFTWGAGVIEWGRMNGTPRGLRARHRRLARASAPRSRRRSPRDGWPVGVNYRSGRRRAPRRSSPRSTTPAAARWPLQARRRRSRRRRRAVRGARGGARAGARAGEQRRHARRRPLAPDRRRGLGTGDRHQPVRRLPPHPRARCGR